ncbi:MAG TPA: histidine--tRNA ligase [Candidatus Acidoferrales bacterium]|nr:histidine--tRNA ligase [Candidatus Acidoferrales bacterium]
MSEATKPEPERRKFRAIKGVRDILPPATDLWNWFEKTARSVLESYNFHEIRLPIFEETELFARSIGGETDVVSKEMYTFPDHNRWDIELMRDEVVRGEPNYVDPGAVDFFRDLANELVNRYRELVVASEMPETPQNKRAIENIKLGLVQTGPEIPPAGPGIAALKASVLSIIQNARSLKFGDIVTLRPEATASVARAYVEHGMHTLPGDQKLYYIGPMFRRERPQKGRYRQFYQIGAEVLGTSDAPAIDAELIEMLTVLIDRCRIEKWTLLVNSIGCPDTAERKGCRPKYVERLREELRKVKDKLGADSQRRIDTNPLRVLDSKLPEEQALIEKLPKISDFLCEDCHAHYEKLKQELKLRQVPFTEAPRLVRGLDYYMRTTFEITSPVLGAQNALCGGGRYDGLVELLGGPRGIKGIGFALGEDRFIVAIEEAKKIHATRPVDVFIAWMGEKAYPAAVRLARVLRGERHTVELPPEEMKFRRALERADKLSARFALIIGEDEVKTGELTIKRLADGKQEKVSEDELVDYFRPKAGT